METGLIARFERKVLFRITRWVALVLCLLLFLGLIGSGLMLLRTLSSGVDRPDPAAVAASDEDGTRSDAGNESLTTSTSSSLDGIRIPPALQELFTAERNRKALENWLDDIERSERQEFVDALGQVAESAKAAGKDQGSAINDYRSRYQDYVLERNLAEAKAASARWQIFAAIGSGLALIALFSLVLVLMAIERNTRNSATQGASS